MISNLQDLLVHELKDVHSAERQLVKALPKMAKAAQSENLRAALTAHLEQTFGHVARVEECLTALGESTRGPKCKGMEGLITEGQEFLNDDPAEHVVDAGIISAGQRVEHYEMAAYGTICEYARVLGHDDVLAAMTLTLNEEKAADETLSMLAEGGINELAASSGDDKDDGEAIDPDAEADGSPAKRRSRMGTTGGKKSAVR